MNDHDDDIIAVAPPSRTVRVGGGGSVTYLAEASSVELKLETSGS